MSSSRQPSSSSARATVRGGRYPAAVSARPSATSVSSQSSGRSRDRAGAAIPGSTGSRSRCSSGASSPVRVVERGPRTHRPIRSSRIRSYGERPRSCGSGVVSTASVISACWSRQPRDPGVSSPAAMAISSRSATASSEEASAGSITAPHVSSSVPGGSIPERCAALRARLRPRSGPASAAVRICLVVSLRAMRAYRSIPRASSRAARASATWQRAARPGPQRAGWPQQTSWTRHCVTDSGPSPAVSVSQAARALSARSGSSRPITARASSTDNTTTACHLMARSWCPGAPGVPGSVNLDGVRDASSPVGRRLRPVAVEPGPNVLTTFLPALRAALNGSGNPLLPHAADRPAPPALGPGDPLAPDEDDDHDPTVVVVATSGSSGAPKGVLLGAAALLASAAAALTGGRRYTALVPTQLVRLLEAAQQGDGDGLRQLARFDAVLVGGAGTPVSVIERAAAAGVRVVTTYGASETSGGCVYDGVPLDGVRVRLEDGPDGSRVLLGGPTLARGYRGGDGGLQGDA